MIADLRGKDVLSNLTGRIVESYHDLETIEHLDQSPLPNYQVVIGIATDLKEILFPGYHQRRNLHWTNVREHVGDLLKGLDERLREQIACALRYEVGGRGLAAGEVWNGDDADKRAREKALAFLQYDSRTSPLDRDRRSGCLRRRPGRSWSGRDYLLLSGARGGHHLSPRARPAYAPRPAHPANDDGVGAQPHRH